MGGLVITVNGSVEGGETLLSRDVVEAAVEGDKVHHLHGEKEEEEKERKGGRHVERCHEVPKGTNPHSQIRYTTNCHALHSFLLGYHLFLHVLADEIHVRGPLIHLRGVVSKVNNQAGLSS